MTSSGPYSQINKSIVPYFQPILSLQNQKIIGYEALGRLITDQGITSLGPFFHDPSISDEEHLHVDRHIRQQAIRRIATDSKDTLLFINLHPSWMYRKYQSASVYPTLRFLEQHNLPPSRVVIEITEEESNASPQELIDIITVYREAGCLIAIDDVGSGYSNFDRIALLRPEIIKIDLMLMKNSVTLQGYNALLRSYSILAEQMGASLLMEGIETDSDLRHALQTGARYVQGFMFSPAVDHLFTPAEYTALLKEQLADYGGEQLARYQELLAVNTIFVTIIQEPLLSDRSDDVDRYIEQILPLLPEHCLRVYLCSEDGTQLSSNYTMNEHGQWVQDLTFRQSNWIWRPYFIPNIVSMQHRSAPTLSQIYTDLETSKILHTYSGETGKGLYLFIDLTV
jgi:EAL domain-containing protein (putative c-di-GMP-specific phosphodiesterase class I)